MKLPLIVPQQVPEFVRAEYPVFLEFIKEYYKWYENEYSLGKLEDLVDIDNTVEQFLQYFKKELDVFGALGAVDNRTYLKRIKELYATKGSTVGIQMLFRLLFAKESSVIHPWDYVFKPSAGVWTQQTSILIDFSDILYNNLNPFDIEGNLVKITDMNGVENVTYVYSVIKRRQSIYEVFIDRFQNANSPFVRLDTIDGSLFGRVTYTTTKVKAVAPGAGFYAGQLFQIGAGGGSGASLTVKGVNVDTGAITSIEVSIGGAGFLTNQQFTLRTPDGTGTGASVRIAVTDSKGTIQAVQLVNNGSGFKLGQVFPLDTWGGGGTVVKIKRVNTKGGVLSAEIISYGVGYASPFMINVTPSGAIDYSIQSSISITKNLDSIGYSTNDNPYASNEDGAVVRHDYTTMSLDEAQFHVDSASVEETINARYMQDPTYVGDVLATIKPTAVDTQKEKPATLWFDVGSLIVYPGEYKNSDNIIGDSAYIQDSNYYQAFSYVTVVEESIDKYASALKRVMHPAGTKHFGLYQMNNTHRITPTLVASLNVNLRDNSLFDVMPDVIDRGISFVYTKYINEDPIPISDRLDRDFIIISSTGGAYLGQFYVGSVAELPTTYWDNGYLEGETPFTN